MPFDTASEAPSLGSMNGYESENTVFSFCERMALVEKNGSMLLGKELCQGHSAAICPKFASRELLRDSLENI
jgi:hypothetical protein